MKKIIIPIDFSEHSEYALKTAAKLAKKHDAELLALHMLEMSDIMLSTTDGIQNQKTMFFLQLAEQKFKKFLSKDYLNDVKVTPIIKHFKVFSEVNDVAKKYDADIIVMGSHGANGFTEYFVGSNTERVVRNSNIPVLVVKNDMLDVDFDVVAFACDFSEESIKSYLSAQEMFSKQGAKLYLIHVNLPNERFKSSLEIEKKVVNFFTKAEGNLDKMEDVFYVSDYTIENGVLNCANKIGADLILVPTHGRKGLAHFFQGSIGEDVVNHATLPVMTFKI
ncbi:universal stress protein [Algibacter amylolyticus]|uniref:Universal stress protein n=1 Tax=Algibacter amylolyticus TaxID=1608400 RepID=A0A5M7B708_9FLAO|nr:universal stress protein [Algibacter amylolyticus]KAA5823454.1 universal stress protein [Algibacter amylolyticus]MBB5267604.1 nucleotide-binding universal stress UspA family protein [Algibacter amylolyticus]TSJ73942.1 universal stress protein [Algibacter amylolyticus]